jgi:hypothetical protein
MIQVEVFWIVMPYSVEVEYQLFIGPCCLTFQGEVIMLGKKWHRYRPSWRGATGAARQ